MACVFDFEKVYGDYGRNFIEVHHVKPLYDLGNEEGQSLLPEFTIYRAVLKRSLFKYTE